MPFVFNPSSPHVSLIPLVFSAIPLCLTHAPHLHSAVPSCFTHAPRLQRHPLISHSFPSSSVSRPLTFARSGQLHCRSPLRLITGLRRGMSILLTSSAVARTAVPRPRPRESRVLGSGGLIVATSAWRHCCRPQWLRCPTVTKSPSASPFIKSAPRTIALRMGTVSAAAPAAD